MDYNNSCILSVCGSHANEVLDAIFKRKIKEIEQSQTCFWLHKSSGAAPNRVQSFCQELEQRQEIPVCLFLSGATKNSTKDTKHANELTHYSVDKEKWLVIDTAKRVTGANNAYAFVFKKLELVNSTIKLWDYVNYYNHDLAVRFNQFTSSAIVNKRPNTTNNRMLVNERLVLAVATFTHPYCVWVKSIKSE